MSPTCLVFVGLLLFAATNGDATEQKEVRNKRNRRSLVNMNNMWKELTGTEGTKFINYGNWCGLGGGGEPVDALDGCCQSHDLCYHEIEQTACKNEGTKALYGKNYYYKIEDGIVTCVWSNKVKFGGYFKKKRRGGRRRRKNFRVIRDINSTYQLSSIEDKNGEACESSLCLCDVVLGNCLKNNHHLYNNENYHPISVYDAIMSGQYIKSLL